MYACLGVCVCEMENTKEACMTKKAIYILSRALRNPSLPGSTARCVRSLLFPLELETVASSGTVLLPYHWQTMWVGSFSKGWVENKLSRVCSSSGTARDRCPAHFGCVRWCLGKICEKLIIRFHPEVCTLRWVPCAGHFEGAAQCGVRMDVCRIGNLLASPINYLASAFSHRLTNKLG